MFVQSPSAIACALQYNITLLPSVNTLIARGIFCGAKYTHHTFTPIIKHLITTTANKHPGKKSFIDKEQEKIPLASSCAYHKKKKKKCHFPRTCTIRPRAQLKSPRFWLPCSDTREHCMHTLVGVQGIALMLLGGGGLTEVKATRICRGV